MTKIPTTMAVRFLREHQVEFTPHLYRWEQKGAVHSAAALGVPVERVVKTIVLQTREKTPFFALMDGTHEVSTKALARALDTKEVQPVEPKRAEQLTGYRVGGISPFGARTPMAVWMASHLVEHPTVWINGGQRGFLVELAPTEIARVLDATLLDMAA